MSLQAIPVRFDSSEVSICSYVNCVTLASSFPKLLSGQVI